MRVIASKGVLVFQLFIFQFPKPLWVPRFFNFSLFSFWLLLYATPICLSLSLFLFLYLIAPIMAISLEGSSNSSLEVVDTTCSSPSTWRLLPITQSTLPAPFSLNKRWLTMEWVWRGVAWHGRGEGGWRLGGWCNSLQPSLFKLRGLFLFFSRWKD